MSEEFDDDEILDDEDDDAPFASQEELEEHEEGDEELSRRIQARGKHDTVMEDMAVEDELESLLDPEEDTSDLYPELDEEEEQLLRDQHPEIFEEEEEEPQAGIRSGGDGTTVRFPSAGNPFRQPAPERKSTGFRYPSLDGRGPGKMV